MALNADDFLEALSKLTNKDSSEDRNKNLFESDFFSGMSKYTDKFKEAVDSFTEGIKLNQDNKIRSNAKEVKTGERGALGNIISNKEEEIAIRNKLIDKYREEEKILSDISDIRIQSEIEFTNLRAKDNDFSITENQKLQADILKQYKDMYDGRSLADKKLYASVDAAEAEIYRKAISDRRKLSNEELKELKRLEKARLLSEENIKKKQEDFKKTITDGLERIINSFGRLVSDAYLFDRLQNSSKNFTNQYESQFTPIAGYTGSDSREETHELITDTLDTVRDNDALRKGLKFNEEVFPKITNAVKNGFLGEEAQDVAITNAVDHKIMPWLETSSDTWVQLQYDLTEERLSQIKGQQLLLQETREGNRILQSGVVSQIQNALLPSLDNVVANTTEVDDLNDEMYAKVMYLMNDMRYSKQEAMKVVQKETDAYQNPLKALTSGDTGDKMLAIDNLYGTDLVGNLARSMQGTGWVGAGAFAATTGLAMGGETRTERGLDVYSGMEEGQKPYLEQIKQGRLRGESIYNDAVENLPEDVTATFEYDANKENKYNAENTNLTAHGADLYQEMLAQVKIIKDNVIKIGAGLLVGKLFEPLISKGLGKLGSVIKSGLGKLLGKGVQEAGEAGAKSVLNGAVSKLGSKLGTGLASNAASVPGAGKLGFMSSGTGAIAGTAVGVAAGGYLVKEGIQGIGDSINTYKDKTSNDIQKDAALKGGIASGAAVAGGAAGAGAILALGASNPIGWAALGIGGLALGIKKYTDHLAELDDATGRITANFDKAKESLDKENDSRKEQLLAIEDNIKALSTTDEKLEYLQKNGIDTSSLKLSEGADNQEKVNAELQKYLDTLINANESNTDESKELIDDMSVQMQNEFNSNVDDVKEAFIKNYSKEALKKEHKGASDEELWGYQKKFLQDAGYNKDEINAMYHHFDDGVMGEKELRKVLDKGAVDGDNIGSWENKIESGDVDVSKVNYRLRSSGVDDVQLIDDEQLAKDMSAFAPSIQYLTKYKEYGRENNKVTENIPEEFSQSEYDSHKSTILSASEDNKQMLTQAFKTKGDSDAMSDWPNSLKGYKLGSTFIPNDMLAILHKGERVLTANQNKDYTKLMTESQNLNPNHINGFDESILNEGQQAYLNKLESDRIARGQQAYEKITNSNIQLAESQSPNNLLSNMFKSIRDKATKGMRLFTMPEENKQFEENKSRLAKALENYKDINPLSNIDLIMGSKLSDANSTNNSNVVDIAGGINDSPINDYSKGNDWTGAGAFSPINDYSKGNDQNQTNITQTESMQELQPNTSSTIQAGVTDIVTAIRQQTADIINYLREASVTSTGNFQKLNMSPAMSNTRVI